MSVTTSLPMHCRTASSRNNLLIDVNSNGPPALQQAGFFVLYQLLLFSFGLNNALNFVLVTRRGLRQLGQRTGHRLRSTVSGKKRVIVDLAGGHYLSLQQRQHDMAATEDQ